MQKKRVPVRNIACPDNPVRRQGQVNPQNTNQRRQDNNPNDPFVQAVTKRYKAHKKTQG
ncbi:hypothetical protein DPF_2307 [Desulfoplanes formicivorans]|uniref:Uncharacterized protein n=1 Tax=Desulfoplanes formicivorans TaxID=1592317 RepID=A0A194AJT5_9BACT|nr:hypothetical protein DPF_2307 [Desulfoplanes formicivorans]